MNKFFLLLIYILTFTSCASQEKGLNASEFFDHLKSEKTKHLIDVRTPEEYSEGHINGAKNVNWNSSNFASELNQLDRNTPLFLYCLSGGRSGNAMLKAKDMGFKKIYGLNGGIMSWRSDKLPLTSSVEVKKTGMTLAEYQALYKGSTKKVLINFFADWCIPCQKMKPFIKKIETKMASNVAVVRINADNNPELCQTLGVSGLPYNMIYINEEVEWKKLGYISEEELVKLLNK